jgi:hypothetical protein
MESLQRVNSDFVARRSACEAGRQLRDGTAAHVFA